MTDRRRLRPDDGDDEDGTPLPLSRLLDRFRGTCSGVRVIDPFSYSGHEETDLVQAFFNADLCGLRFAAASSTLWRRRLVMSKHHAKQRVKRLEGRLPANRQMFLV